jgi:hypothetical protein
MVIIPASVVVFLSFASLYFIDLRISSKNTYIAAVYVTIVNLILFINNYKIKGLTFLLKYFIYNRNLNYLIKYKL